MINAITQPIFEKYNKIYKAQGIVFAYKLRFRKKNVIAEIRILQNNEVNNVGSVQDLSREDVLAILFKYKIKEDDFLEILKYSCRLEGSYYWKNWWDKYKGQV